MKDPKKFTFRPKIWTTASPRPGSSSTPTSAAIPTGRLPDDTWILRPQDLPDGFTPDEDTWYFPRVAGTFKERAGFHGCQMPEQLLGRIIRVCSNPGELVLDPFGGSGTTLVVGQEARPELPGLRIVRRICRPWASAAGKRRRWRPPEGAPEPLVDAPLTREGKSLVDGPGKRIRNKNEVLAPRQIPTEHEISRARSLYEKGLLAAFATVHAGYSLDRVIADPDLNAALADECCRLGLAGEARTWNYALFNLRKRGRLSGIPAQRRTEIDWRQCDNFLFASEIAWKKLMVDGLGEAWTKFSAIRRWLSNSIASRPASPDFKPLEYRWAA